MHTVRKAGGLHQVARINKVSASHLVGPIMSDCDGSGQVVAFKSDGYFGVFVEEPGKVSGSYAGCGRR